MLRAYYYLIHAVFVWPGVRAEWYRWHPVAWDQLCFLRFPKLDQLLTEYAELHPNLGRREIERLISGFPSNRRSALQARCRMIARDAGRCVALIDLPAIVNQLPDGDRGFLTQTSDIRQWVEEISHQQQAANREVLAVYRERQSDRICELISQFRDRIAGLHEPLASEFRAAATNWQQLASDQLADAKAQLERESVPQVFRAGDPVDRDPEAFVPRTEAIQELQSQILLSTGCPGVLLYARRRMGKSTFLKNLYGFLPTNIDVVNINMEDVKANSSTASFCEFTAARMRETSTAGLPDRNVADLVTLRDFLEQANQRLNDTGRKLVLALDEFEYIDAKIGDGVFNTDLLGLMRTSIQSHRHIIWLFAGSHGIRELTNAEWPSYFISLRTVEIERFSDDETFTLLTDPLAHSSLWERDDPDRPRFAPEFWGDGGIQRLQREADGWPHLVQLLAETAINIVNRRQSETVTPEVWDQVLAKAIVGGDNVMIQLLQNESRLTGEWDYLTGFKTVDTQPLPEDANLLKSLHRRSLIAVEDGRCRLRVPLMLRWLRERG